MRARSLRLRAVRARETLGALVIATRAVATFGALALLASAACAPQRSSDDARPVELLVTSDAETLDPRYAVDAVGLRATRLVHAGLVRLDPDTLEPIPYAARGWTWLDERRLRVELRETARFHSGAKLTSRDVAATIRAFASPRVASRHARVVEPILSVDEDGEDAVVITLKRAHATLLTDLEVPILRADQAESPPAPDGTLDGLGPYAIASVRRGEIVLRPSGSTLLGAAPRRAAAIRTVHDENARALRLIAGRSDIALNVLSPTLLPALTSEPGLTIRARPAANLTYLLARSDRGPLASVEARRAVSLLVDRDALTRALFAGYAHPASSLLPPVHWAHADAPAMAHDPAAARALLGGAPLAFTLLTSTDRMRISVARVIAQELEAGGVHVDVVPLELGTMIARLNSGDFDAAILQLPEIAEPNVLRVFLHSANIPPSGANRARVRDAEVDALLDEGDRVTERAARRAVYARLEDRLRERLYMIPLWHEDHVTVTTARAAAFTPSAEGRWLGLANIP